MNNLKDKIKDKLTMEYVREKFALAVGDLGVLCIGLVFGYFIKLYITKF